MWKDVWYYGMKGSKNSMFRVSFSTTNNKRGHLQRLWVCCCVCVYVCTCTYPTSWRVSWGVGFNLLHHV